MPFRLGKDSGTASVAMLDLVICGTTRLTRIYDPPDAELRPRQVLTAGILVIP
jgi:hypothetical protein